MKQLLLLLSVLLLPFCLSAKTAYTYKLEIDSNEPSNDKPYVFPDVNNCY